MRKTRYPQHGELAPRDFYEKLIQTGGNLEHVAKLQGVTVEQINQLVESD